MTIEINEPIRFTGDLVQCGETAALSKVLKIAPVDAYREGAEIGEWSELPARSVGIDIEYIELKDVTLYNLFGCYGLVELSDGRFYSLTDNGAFNVHCNIFITKIGENFYKRPHESIETVVTKKFHGKYFLPYRLAGIYYFHFVSEILQNVFNALRYWPDAKVLLPGCGKFFERFPQQVCIDAVQALVPYTEGQIWLEEGIYKIDHLIVPRQWLYADCAYADEILRHAPVRSSSGPRIAYISRSHAGNRRIANEPAVIEAIKGLLPSCEVVQLEEMSFGDQVGLFREASIIVSPHGGGLANLVFCHPETIIIEILPADCSYMYRDLAQIRSLRYLAYVPANAAWDAPSYEIDVQQFRSVVSMAINASVFRMRTRAMLKERVSGFPIEGGATSLEVAMEQARSALREKNLAGVKQIWERIRMHFAQDYRACFEIGNSLLQLGWLDEAEVVLGDVIQRFPDHLWAAQRYAQVSDARLDRSEAIHRWNLVKKRFPESAVGHIGEALTLRDSGRTGEAEQVLSEAVRLYPDDYWAAFHHALLPSIAQRWPIAISRWDRVRAQFPQQSAPSLKLSEAMLALDRAVEAMEVLNDAMSRFPDDKALKEFHEKVRSLRTAVNITA